MIVVALVLLAMAWMSNFDELDAYAPSHHLIDWAYLFVTTYVYGAYRVARVAHASTLRRMILVQTGLLFAALATFLAYHAQHPGLADSGWSWRSPYHVQLAVPVFLGLFLAAAIAALSLRLQLTLSATLQRCGSSASSAAASGSASSS